MALDNWQAANDNIHLPTSEREEFFSFIKTQCMAIKDLFEQRKKTGDGWVDFSEIQNIVTTQDKSSGAGAVEHGDNVVFAYLYLKNLTARGILEKRMVDPTLNDVRERKQIRDELPSEYSGFVRKLSHRKSQYKITYTP